MPDLSRGYPRAAAARVHSLPDKFHGTIKGKSAIVVNRLEEESGTVISFSKEDGGQVKILGARQACVEAWACMQHVKATLPKLLAQLRAGEVRSGDFGSDPGRAFDGALDAEEVWKVAVEEALFRYKHGK